MRSPFSELGLGHTLVAAGTARSSWAPPAKSELRRLGPSCPCAATTHAVRAALKRSTARAGLCAALSREGTGFESSRMAGPRAGHGLTGGLMQAPAVTGPGDVPADAALATRSKTIWADIGTSGRARPGSSPSGRRAPALRRRTGRGHLCGGRGQVIRRRVSASSLPVQGRSSGARGHSAPSPKSCSSEISSRASSRLQFRLSQSAVVTDPRSHRAMAPCL